MNVRQLARDERADLAAFLKTLRPEDWETDSLCQGWRVRDLIAHVISFDELGSGRFFARVLRSRLSPDRVNAWAVAEATERSPADLLSSLEDHLDPRGPLTVFGCLPAFFDAFVHHQDIRRPMAAPRVIPTQRLMQALRAAFLSPFVGGRARARGLRFVATDIEWSRGEGPEVFGPAESIVMAVAGRCGVIEELTGPGLSTLEGRTVHPQR